MTNPGGEQAAKGRCHLVSYESGDTVLFRLRNCHDHEEHSLFGEGLLLRAYSAPSLSKMAFQLLKNEIKSDTLFKWHYIFLIFFVLVQLAPSNFSPFLKKST